MDFLGDLKHLIELVLRENIPILELCENIPILELRENIPILDVLTKLSFWPFWPLEALKVNNDLEFEIFSLSSPYKPILSHLNSCFGLFFELSQKKMMKGLILELALR